jgi:hypothetical protein
MKKIYIIILLALFSINIFAKQNNYTIFAEWIGGLSTPTDKGKLTALPLFTFCQRNVLNVSNMLKHEELPEVNSKRWLSLEDFEGEIWKDVVGYEGLYQVSNYGRLKSLTRRCRLPNKKPISVPYERILVTSITNGYCKKMICKDGKMFNTNIHRLEALAFIPNPENKPCIDHIDGNRKNNCLYNLRWCTVKENMNNKITVQRISEGKLGSLHPQSKRVAQLDMNGNVVKIWGSIREAEREGGFHGSSISACCLGKEKSHYGYMWKHLDNKNLI